MLFPNLPIVDVLSDLIDALAQRDEVVLQAPPGAGKTTVVPLALLDQSWLAGQKILMLEPRRLAAKAAAERMAELLGEPVGQTVGYRMRLETRVSAATRIEVITEGILTRLLQSDPSLAGVGLIIFDEFHERSLDADLGLALALQGRRLFRNPADGELPLKILLMSATLDEARMTLLLSRDGVAAPLVRSEGRQFPVSVRYVDTYKPQDPIIPKVIAAVLDALRAETGSVLVFLPGQAEIRAVNSALVEALGQSQDILLAPLFGDLSLAEQRSAIAPVATGKRKVVLATNIAESSLTIEGVSVVVDSGLARAPMFDPGTGMTRLQTRRVSKASSIQRMGRAGRLQAGVCYRLWSDSQQEQLQPFTSPEILQADLAPLALQLVCWGIDDPAELDWLDPPPQAAYQQALDLLHGLNAIQSRPKQSWKITEHGQAMANFPAHPRLAHMLLLGVQTGLGELACDLAALLSDRDPLYRPDGSAGADVADRVEWLQRQASSAQAKRLRQQSQQFRKLCEGLGSKAPTQPRLSEDDAIGFLIASAYPDRIAKSRERTGPTNAQQQRDYALSNGRAATLRMPDHLAKSEWLAVAQLGGREGDSRDQIYLAARLNPQLFDDALKSMVTSAEQVDWDKDRERFRAERQRRIGKLVLDSIVLEDIAPEAKRHVLLTLVRKRGLSLLPWTDDLRQWQARVCLLAQSDGSGIWPDVSDQHLLATLEDWLGPYIDHINHINGFARLDLASILQSLLPWPLPKQLEEDAPETIKVPSGSNIQIDYSTMPPVLAVRLQEMFGCAHTPTIAQGKIPLLLHLLSPARRPLAVTQNLTSFWQNAYPEVKKEGKGRYPKHYWPDNPLEAEATARAKPRK